MFDNEVVENGFFKSEGAAVVFSQTGDGHA
jgi:hypothetical protein